MKKIIFVLLAVLMLSFLFTGCGKPSANNGATSEDNASAEDVVDAEDDVDAEEPTEIPADNGASSSGSMVADSYTAYIEAKGVVIGKISEGLSSNPDTAFTALSMLGVTMVDLAIIPVSFFGLGQQSVEMGLSMFGATDVKYTENGNSYSVTYTDEEGVTYNFSGTYDAAADVLVCTATTDGKENIYSEYHKTSFGYVGQYYFLNEDGTTSIYLVAVDGENGTIGISTAPGKPAALTGSEGPDFPTSCTEWYNVTGLTITGVTSDGTELNFEYTPTATEE